jgi:anthranilate 1,2-dioxygenase small subunit
MNHDPSLYLEVLAVYAEYARRIDDARFDDWLDLFADDCAYHVVPRENQQRGLPLPIIRCRTRDMLQDRIVSLQQANIYNIHNDRHLVSGVVVRAGEGDTVSAEADFAIFQTDQEGETRLFSVGRYHTRFVRSAGALKIVEQKAIIDTASIATLMSTPV